MSCKSCKQKRVTNEDVVRKQAVIQKGVMVFAIIWGLFGIYGVYCFFKNVL